MTRPCVTRPRSISLFQLSHYALLERDWRCWQMPVSVIETNRSVRPLGSDSFDSTRELGMFQIELSRRLQIQLGYRLFLRMDSISPIIIQDCMTDVTKQGKQSVYACTYLMCTTCLFRFSKKWRMLVANHTTPKSQCHDKRSRG